MKRLLRKASDKKAELIGKVSLCGHVYTVAADGDLALGLIDGHRVVDASLLDNPISKIIPVMAGLIAKAFREGWYQGLTVDLYGGDWDSLGKYPSLEYRDALNKELQELLGASAVALKEGSLDEPSEKGSPSEGSSVQGALTLYAAQLESVLLAAENLMEKSESLLRVKFVSTMWGVSKLQVALEPVRQEYPGIPDLFNRLGLGVNMSKKAVTRLACRFKMWEGTSLDDRKMVGAVIIPDILTNYEIVVREVTTLLRALSPLYKMDNLFRIYTGNSASWAIPSNLTIDFKEAFHTLQTFLVGIPVWEKQIMEPLEILQGRLTKSIAVRK